MHRRMPEVQTRIHAAALTARRLLDFDLVAHLSLEDLHNLFASLQISNDEEFPRLRIARRRGPSRRFKDCLYEIVGDWRILHESGANATAPFKHVEKNLD